MRWLLFLIPAAILLSGCSDQWVHPHKTTAQIKQDCNECNAQASRITTDQKSPEYKAAYYDCMKAKNYQLKESDFSTSMKITAVVISVLVGLSLGAG